VKPVALVPRLPVPPLSVELVRGGRLTIGEHPPAAFDLLVFYRGLHCPICVKYLLELERLSPEFAGRGVRVTALSSDTQDRARQMADKVQAQGVQIGWGLSLDTARQWGLYITASRGKTSVGIEEPALFNEPGVFLVRPDASLYYAAVQTMPFARPPFQDLLSAVDAAITRDYPARGEYTGAL
jgi:peroxiredoxin